jgi:putative copper export protein
VLNPTSDTIRLFLHVLAAAVWVGGQIVLAGLVPRLRRESPPTTRIAARAFGAVAWPAFLLLFATGMWSIVDLGLSEQSTEYQATVAVHLVLAVVAAASAAIHSLGRSKLALALGGAIGLLTSLGALFVGMLLRTGA